MGEINTRWIIVICFVTIAVLIDCVILFKYHIQGSTWTESQSKKKHSKNNKTGNDYLFRTGYVAIILFIIVVFAQIIRIFQLSYKPKWDNITELFENIIESFSFTTTLLFTYLRLKITLNNSVYSIK